MNALSTIKTVPEIVTFAADHYGDRPALSRAPVCADSTLSFTDLHKKMRQGADRLSASKLQAGTPVLLMLDEGPDRMAAFFAILAAGLVAVPFPSSLSPADGISLARHLKASLILVEKPAVVNFPSQSAVTLLTAEELFQPAVNGSLATLPAPEATALLVPTSGTTKASRMVALSHANLVSNIQAVLQAYRPGPDESLLSVLPTSHLFELVVGQLCPLLSGAQVIYANTPMPNRLIQLLVEERVTRILLVPALLDLLGRQIIDQFRVIPGVVAGQKPQSILELASLLTPLSTLRRKQLRAALSATLPETLRHIVVGGAALEPSWSIVLKALGIELDIGYGLTEAGPVVSLGNSSQCPSGSVGRPLPGLEVRTDCRGEVLVKGPSIMAGYYQAPVETAEVFTKGWLRTGDQGYLDEDGFLFIRGRLKEAMVTAAGLTVYPEEIEPYYQDPHFRELCTVPVADGLTNETPVLVVVPASPTLSNNEILQLFHRLRAVAPSDCRVSTIKVHSGPLPRNSSGKILRRTLAKSLNFSESPINRAMNEHQLRSLLTELSGINSEKLAANDDLLETLNLDSLAALRLLAAIEQQFNVQLRDDQLCEFRTLDQLLDALEQTQQLEIAV